MTAALPSVLNLATAGQLDLARASDIVTDMMTMFGMEADEASKASDIFAAAQSKSNTNVEQLSEALLNAGPAASAAGASLEETSAILGLFANNGIKGGRAGTILNAMFRDVQASAEDGAIAIGELRTVVSNGITLCADCHMGFHNTYGYTNNNHTQLNKYIKHKRKIIMSQAQQKCCEGATTR